MSIFEHLEAQAIEENLPFKNAAVVAIDRCERRFGAFISSAKGEREFQARIDLVRGEVEKIAVAACEEHGYDDARHVAKLVLGQLDILAAKPADAVGNAETQNLPTQSPDGYYTEPSPKLNPGSAGDHMKNTNPPIAELAPDDKQHPDDAEWPWDSALPAANLVDADKPMQPEFNVGDNTQTFPNKGQADPVTSKTAAERMDFNVLSEIMTPSDAISELTKAGMPEHEAKDRIDFYVNHVDPGWAHKSWTSAVADEDEELGAALSELFDGDDAMVEEDVTMEEPVDEYGFDEVPEETANTDELDAIAEMDDIDEDVAIDEAMRMETKTKIGQIVFESFLNKNNK